ncbi:retrovirus-related pol polyprotein from transposon TNT 1-94 [Tanacetum coccineum]
MLEEKTCLFRTSLVSVAKGYDKEDGNDFWDSFAPILEWTTKRGSFCRQPDGFVELEFPNHVYRLKKALYGLEQAPRAWYDKLSSFLIEHHFTKGIVDPTLFIRRHGDDICLQDTPVDQTMYRSIIGGITYLTASRLDIAYATFVCARYQARPTDKHLKEMPAIAGLCMYPVCFVRASSHLDENTTAGLWISFQQDSDIL